MNDFCLEMSMSTTAVVTLKEISVRIIRLEFKLTVCVGKDKGGVADYNIIYLYN